jgi:fumarate reductase subunit D
MRRSTQPVFWLLFGAGGMLSATVGAMLVFITGIAIPLGLFLPSDLLSYANALAFERHWLAKAFTLAVISLFLWHGVHRIFHSLHDIGVHSRGAAAIACYGIALTGTLAALAALLAIGF